MVSGTRGGQHQCEERAWEKIKIHGGGKRAMPGSINLYEFTFQKDKCEFGMFGQMC